MSAMMLVLTGFMQPLSRYNYRQIVDQVKQQSFEAVFQEGKFAQVGNRVFWTDDKARSGQVLGNVFIFEAAEDGSLRIMTAPAGEIDADENEGFVRFSLIEGQGFTVERERGFYRELDFKRRDWTISQSLNQYRLRGEDPHELMLPELFELSNEPGAESVRQQTAKTYMHTQIGRAVILLLMPFLAIPLGLGYGRSFQSTGIAVGIVLLLIIQKSLEIGESMAIKGSIPAWAGTWPVVTIVALFSFWLFARSAFRVTTPPLMLLSIDIGGLFSKPKSFIQNLFSRQAEGS